MGNAINLSLEENIFLAKKTIVNNIYNSAKIEGCNVTFPQTQTILDGVSVGGISMDDVQCIMNLRDAWRFVLDNINNPMSLEQLKKINSFVSRNESLQWGVLRTGDVGITMVEYHPEIPDEKEVLKKIDDLLKIENITDRAIKFMLFAMRSQLFWDGNKRTSMIAANQILIQNGGGVLTVNEEHLEEFNVKLKEFYETNNDNNLTVFLKEKCIFGIKYNQEIKKENKRGLQR